MNCRDFEAQIDEYLAGELPPIATDAAGVHLHDCAACQQRIARRQALRAALRSQIVPAPRPGFFTQALLQAQQPSRRWFARWPRLAGAAIAASLAAWVGLSGLPGFSSSPRLEPMGVTIALHETHSVSLSFNAERELTGAMLHIRLPDGIEVRGFPGQREIQWRTDLARGVNMLTLPLTAVAASDGALTARLVHGDRSTELTVRVSVSLNNAKATQGPQA